MTQEQVGKLIGVEKASVSKYEAGDTALHAKALSVYAEIGNKTIDWLVTGIEADIRSPKQIIHGHTDPQVLAMVKDVVGKIEAAEQLVGITLPTAKKQELYELVVKQELQGKPVDADFIKNLISLAS